MKRAVIAYSDAEMAWLEANRMLVISDYHREFVAAFGRADISAAQLHGLRKRKGWKTGRDGARYRGRSRLYSAAELGWLRANCTMTLPQWHAGFVAAFGRNDITVAQLLSLRKNRGWKTGRTGRFEKGTAPSNKGKVCPPGTGGRHPNAVRTQFRKGAIPQTYRGPGHEWIDKKDGYVILIVAETNPYTGAATRPVHKHRWLWEQAHGPIPDDHILKCLDGDKTNTDPSNWEAVPRGVLARLNGGPHRKHIAYDAAPAELKPTVLAVAKLRHAVGQRRRAKREAS